jgi:hypothetical protein
MSVVVGPKPVPFTVNWIWGLPEVTEAGLTDVSV